MTFDPITEEVVSAQIGEIPPSKQLSDQEIAQMEQVQPSDQGVLAGTLYNELRALGMDPNYPPLRTIGGSTVLHPDDSLEPGKGGANSLLRKR